MSLHVCTFTPDNPVGALGGKAGCSSHGLAKAAVQRSVHKGEGRRLALITEGLLRCSGEKGVGTAVQPPNPPPKRQEGQRRCPWGSWGLKGAEGPSLVLQGGCPPSRASVERGLGGEGFLKGEAGGGGGLRSIFFFSLWHS